MIYAVAVFAPLLGAIVSGLLGRAIGDRAAEAVSILVMVVAAICGVTSFIWIGFLHEPDGTVDIGSWIEAGSFRASWALRYDTLSAVMVGMVTFVSTLIHIYSVGYMEHDAFPRYRFFAYLNLFTFAMLMLVTSDNLLQLFFGWEGVGLASYLLIGYWYDRPSANAAAIKAMMVNRVADLPFAVGIALVFLTFGSIGFPVIFGWHPAAHERPVSCARHRLARLRGDRGAAVHRRDGQVGANLPAHLAAGRDGGTDAGFRADPCRDDGDGGRVPDGADVADHELRTRRARLRHDHRRHHLAVRRHDRLHAVRHQEGDRLLDLLAARLHVHRRRGRGVPGVDLPSVLPRLLQGAAVSRARVR